MHKTTSWLDRAARAAVVALAAAALWVGVASGPMAAPVAADETKNAAPTVVVDLNAATAADLQKLPGIGPSKAGAIVALRERLGRFRRIEQILRVRGIGRATFRKIRPMIEVK